MFELEVDGVDGEGRRHRRWSSERRDREQLRGETLSETTAPSQS